MKQIRIDELYAVAKVTNGLLTGRAKKSEIKHYVWFYDQVTDILARALVDDDECCIRAEPEIPRTPLTEYEKNLLEHILTRNAQPVIPGTLYKDGNNPAGLYIGGSNEDPDKGIMEVQP